MGCIRPIRIATPLGGHVIFGQTQRDKCLALSADPVDQTCGIQQRGCFIELLLDVERYFKTLLMKAGTGAGIGCAPYSRGPIKPATDFS